MGTTTTDWFENDAFWEGMSGLLFNATRWGNTAGEIDHVQALTGFTKGTKVLDLACGAGRHSLEMARRGCRVTAVDRTAAYLDIARRKAADEGLDVEVVRSDMRRFARAGAFDVAVCLWGSFGYFRDPGDDRRVLANLHRSLKPGGTLLIDHNGKEVFARGFQPKSWYEQDGVLVLEERSVAADFSRVDSRWIKVDAATSPGGAARRQEWNLSVRLYSAVELVGMLRDAGFGDVKVFGGLDGTPYDHNARRLVVSAVKQPAATARKPERVVARPGEVVRSARIEKPRGPTWRKNGKRLTPASSRGSKS